MKKSVIYGTITGYFKVTRKDFSMSKVCVMCDKRPRVGNIVSHANNKTKRIFNPNVHTIRYKIAGSRSINRGSVCTKCVKAGKVEKVI